MTKRGLAAVALSVLAGCTSPGELVAEHAAGGPVGVRGVDRAGRYGLFMAGDDRPLLQYPLGAGDRVGFEQSAATLPAAQLQVRWLYAVAGSDRRRLDGRQTYQWRRLADRR